MVKLPPHDQARLIESDPACFVLVKGAWGRQGATNVRLKSATAQKLKPALLAAWKNTGKR